MVKPRAFNWALIFGTLLIAFTVVLAIWGPAWAPRDPLERTTGLIKINGEWDRAPFPPGTPGFPLGSDEGGRDILTRVLWAVRPTMQMVLVVALVRLGMGVLIGLISGGGRGQISTFFETLTSTALTVPTLLVALAVLFKVNLGDMPGVYGPRLWSFILGLALTGWAETAQVIREQTRVLLSQAYVEASRALGASRIRTFRRHIVPHLMPLVWIQFAFEVGATLMLTGGLGFLGLFIGGIAPMLEGDPFVLSGYPELGEMLSTTINVIVQPWGMVAAGSVVFLTVLGFNLLGQGLRVRWLRARPGRETVFTRLGLWLDEYVSYPVGELLRGPLRVPLQGGALLLGIGALLWVGNWLRPRLTPQIEQLPTTIVESFIPPPTATSTPPPAQAQLLWSFEAPTGLPVPPLVTRDGNIFLITHQAELYAFSPDGTLRWQQVLTAPPFTDMDQDTFTDITLPLVDLGGGMIGIVSEKRVYALNAMGEEVWDVPLDAPPSYKGCCTLSAGALYLLDHASGLYAIGQNGEPLWKYTPESEFVSPGSAPVFASDGRVFFAAGPEGRMSLYAVSPNGTGLWETEVPKERFGSAFMGINDFRWLDLSADETVIFLSGDAFDATTGTVLTFDLETTVVEIEQAQNPNETITAESLGIRRWGMRMGEWNEGLYLLTDPYLFELTRQADTLILERYAPLNFFSVARGLLVPPLFTNETVWTYSVDANDLNDTVFLKDPGAHSRFLTWADLTTSESGTIEIPRGDYVAALDAGTGAAYLCRAQRAPDQITCERRTPWESAPTPWFVLEGIRNIKYIQLDLEAGRLYVFGKNNVFYVVDVDATLPEP